MQKLLEIEAAARRRERGRYDYNGIMLDIVPESSFLLISCTGYCPEMEVRYATENAPDKICMSRLFLSDKSNMWYYNGIDGLTSTLSGTVEAVRRIIAALKPSQTYAIGTSGGGYMAIALTSFLCLDRALAFAPQTILSERDREEFGDTRWPQTTKAITSNNIFTWDLKDLIACTPVRSEFTILYPMRSKLDRHHVMRVRAKSNLHLIGVETNNHNLAAHLLYIKAMQPLINVFADHRTEFEAWTRFAETQLAMACEAILSVA